MVTSQAVPTPTTSVIAPTPAISRTVVHSERGRTVSIR
jgi:hypothetical protein